MEGNGERAAELDPGRAQEEWEPVPEWGQKVIYCGSALRRTLSHLLPQVPFKGNTIMPIFLIKRLSLGRCSLLQITGPV